MTAIHKETAQPRFQQYDHVEDPREGEASGVTRQAQTFGTKPPEPLARLFENESAVPRKINPGEPGSTVRQLTEHPKETRRRLIAAEAIKEPVLTWVVDLRTGQQQGFTLPAKQAVNAAYEADRKNFNTWNYPMTVHLVEQKGQIVRRGNFVTLDEKST